MNDQNLKINLFQKRPLPEKCPFTFECLRIGPMNFCVTSQYVAEIEMKYENSANGMLKYIYEEEKIEVLNGNDFSTLKYRIGTFRLLYNPFNILG